ncbi:MULTISPECIES: FTR1 family protein [Acidobacterium]|uniref:FTR1 family iron permease n=1 Tax=Acidobacterium TaxID=33973 RepID=UPI000A025EF8|nr:MULTISPECIES: FTR1 family protein [Acidobacterium]HCT59506.1 iron permease [Acidobacterium sp.]
MLNVDNDLRTVPEPPVKLKLILWAVFGGLSLALLGVLIWQGITAAGNPDPLAQARGSLAGILDIAILVFREGLECILVLSAITASMVKSHESYQRPVAAGVGMGFLATLVTWFIAVGIVNDLTKSMNALYVQAATGLLAIFVLLVVMNWFFHKVYWTGWISMHNRRKRDLIQTAGDKDISKRRVLFGMALLGFTSFYREGVEVVLFLQSYRLKLGGDTVFYGVLLGLLFTGVVAILTFMGHRKLPYKRMLVLTGVMLGAVLLVMVGEQAQEMQLAHWLPTTVIPSLVRFTPAWMGLWFSIFPTVQTLSAQAIAAVLVVGSYFLARR